MTRPLSLTCSLPDSGGMVPTSTGMAPTSTGMAWPEAAGLRDRFLAMHRIYALYTPPLDRPGDQVRWQHHPAVAALKNRLEAIWIADLDQETRPLTEPDRTEEELRRLATRDRSPDIYRWIADQAPWDDAMRFLALEGGPDNALDDLVAIRQLGLPLSSDNMGSPNGDGDEPGDGGYGTARSVLYRQFVEAVDLPTIPLEDQPVEALERSAVLGLVASNGFLHPEMIGALGLTELEAGRHCCYVDQGLERLGASDQAREFYQRHAAVDPVHGQGWLEHGVRPLVATNPTLGPRILRGARWKRRVDDRFFDWAERALVTVAA